MKRFLTFLVIFVLTISMIPLMYCNAVPSVEVENVRYTYEDMDVLIAKLGEQENLRETAHQMAECARALGESEDSESIQTAKEHWVNADNLVKEYSAAIEKLEARYTKQEQEYPEATYIWKFLKDAGYNDYVCAGILGNIMNEVGGNTLKIQPTIYGKGYYGMCQWNKNYSKIWGASLENQCDFLLDTIEYEFNTFGGAYRRNFKYQDFTKLTNASQAALAFAKSYERCGSGSYKARQNNAVAAYNYFVS